MAQERPLTPEKQLLKFIESSKLSTAGVHAQAARRQGMSFLNLGAWLGRISFLKVRFEKWRHNFSLEQLDVKAVNRLLASLTALLIIYFFSSLLVSLFNLNKLPRLELKTPAGKIETTLAEPSAFKKAVSFYLDKVRERDIFTMGQKKPAPAQTGAKTGSSSKTLNVFENLKLVGISWSNDPDAMIEDSKALRTFFVKRGEMVGEAKVQAIFKDKVVLSYNGEEFELK